MGFAHRAFVAAGVGFVASAIVGCGSSGGSWLSASQSNNLTEQLNRVTQALDNGQCAQAQQYLADFQSRVDSMGGVNSTLIDNLDQGVSTIQSLTNRECRTVTIAPRRTHPKTTTTTTTTATRTTQTFTNPATQPYSTPTYTQPAYSSPTTSTTGGSGLTVPTTTTTSSSATPSTTPPPPTPSSGGGGLGGGTDTTSTTGDTTTTSTTAENGTGF